MRFLPFPAALSLVSWSILWISSSSSVYDVDAFSPMPTAFPLSRSCFTTTTTTATTTMIPARTSVTTSNPSHCCGRMTTRRNRSSSSSRLVLWASSSLLSVTLDKPLGLVLEEVEEGASMGVKVQELGDGGSAITSPYKDQLVGLKVAKVMGDDVTTLDFDTVMDKIINAPSPITLDFELMNKQDKTDTATTTSKTTTTTTTTTMSPPPPDTNVMEELSIGTTVTIKVIQPDKPDLVLLLEAKVGDNLRTTLLENKVELYRGLKKKLGNCGGGGQCGFCAVELTEEENNNYWDTRSEYEEKKIAKSLGPNVRLACMNNIVGPATVKTL